MSTMFKVTREEIEEEKKPKFFELTDGYNYKMVITELDERKDDAVIVKNTIIECAQDIKQNGMSYNNYFSPTLYGRKSFLKLMKHFSTDDEMLAGIMPTSLIGGVYTCKAVASKPKEGTDKIYINIGEIKRCDGGQSNDVPDFGDDETEVKTPVKTDAELLKEAKAEQAAQTVEDFGKTKQNNGLF